jgi:hypothetical protein
MDHPANVMFPRLKLLLLVPIATVTARADIEFVGILATTQAHHFALGDTTTGKTTWVVRGDTFAGYTVVGYEPGTDTILLRRDGADRRIRLKNDAKVKAARLELTGSISFGATEKIEIERATLIFDQENVFPLRDGITYRITPQRAPDGKIHYRAAIERVVAPNMTERLSSPTIVTLPGQQFSMRIDAFCFSFTPR